MIRISNKSTVEQAERALFNARLAYAEVNYEWRKLHPVHRGNLRAAARLAYPDGTELERFAFQNDVPEWFYHLVLLRADRVHIVSELRPDRAADYLGRLGFNVTIEQVTEWFDLAAANTMRKFIRPDLFAELAAEVRKHVWFPVRDERRAAQEKGHVFN